MMMAYILQEKLTIIKVKIPFMIIILVGFIGIIIGSLVIERTGLYSADQEHTLNNNKALISLIKKDREVFND